MGKVHSIGALPLGLWGIKSSSRTLLLDFFDYAEQKGYLKILIEGLGKMSVGGA